MFVCSCILLCSSSQPLSSLSVISLLHVRLSHVIKIILTYLIRFAKTMCTVTQCPTSCCHTCFGVMALPPTMSRQNDCESFLAGVSLYSLPCCKNTHTHVQHSPNIKLHPQRKKRSERCKYCALALVRRSQKFSPHCRPSSPGRGMAKI